MRRILGITAKTIGGVTIAFALFAVGVLATVLMLGIRDVYADDTRIEERSYKMEQRTIDTAPRVAMDDDDDDTVIEKRTHVEERRVVPAPAPQVIEERTRVETVPAAPVVQERTTIKQVVPPPAVIEKRTERVEVEEDD